MPLISDKGNKNAKIWVLFEHPYSSDIPKAQLLSGGLGSVFYKMFKEAKLDWNSCYFCSRAPDTDTPMGFYNVEGSLQQYQPPLILVVGDAGGWYLPELREKGQGVTTSKGQLQKYAGSLLKCDSLNFPHYMIPLYGPDRCIADWQERNITTYVDLQKVRDEYEYWQKNGQLRELKKRTLVYGDLELHSILQSIDKFKSAKLLSVDVETVYPRTGSAFLPHPGYPITVGLADASDYGISFNLFRNSPRENNILWRALDDLLKRVPCLGQNFFNFDALFFESLGFNIPLEKVQDTLLRHHILWPELSHKLQFMTRQYTREPYYKDEGHGWSVKYMDRLRRYNCLDVCCTYEIYEAQEQEFKERPHLA